MIAKRIDVNRILAIIMGGGRGTRLYPLVKYRCKPAVPLAGRYRLIDVPISNCLNSGINRIFVLTQFNSRSLNNHVNTTYHFGPAARGHVEIIAASQSEDADTWFQGTADAVRRCLQFLDPSRVSHVLILSGDQLYAMNYQLMMVTHENHDAEVTIACKDVSERDARRFGIMRTDEHERIVDFVEKPQTEAELALVRSGEGRYWASLGIYFFEINVLMKLLGEVKGMDFGRDVIPHAVRGAYRVAAHSFSGYWEDIGTIASFFAANLGLVCPMPPINLFDPSWTMYTRPRFLPPTKVERSALEAVLLADGSLIHSAAIKRSVVGIRTVIRQDTTVEDSILMGADYYVPDDNASALPTMGIGRGCRIRRAIVDKNVRIGDGCRIVNEQNRQNADGPGWSIRDGIVVIEKNAVIPPETVI